MVISQRFARYSVMAIAVAMAAASRDAHATLLYYDPFNIGANPAVGEYTVGDMNGQNPTPGPTAFFSSPWTLGGPNGEDVVATGLQYLGAPVSGGSAFVNGQGREGRTMTTPLTATTNGTFYMGFLMNFGSTGGVGHRTFEMWNDGGVIGNDGNLTLSIGYHGFAGDGDANTSRIRARVNNSGTFDPNGLVQGSPTFATDNKTHLLVFKMVLSDVAASDTFSVYFDPFNTTEPAIPSTQFTGIDFTLGSIGSGVHFGGGNGPGFDEFRFATTFAEAIPAIPPVPVKLIVNKTTGQVSLRNDGAVPFNFNYYQITSAASGLDAASWNSLDDQNFDAGKPTDFDNNSSVNNADLGILKTAFGTNANGDANGDGVTDGTDFLLWQQDVGAPLTAADGWIEAGGASNAQLGELRLNGATTIAPGASLSIGAAYESSVFGGADGDLQFRIDGGISAGTLRASDVIYVTSATAVPEPASAVLCLAALGWLAVSKRRS